MAVYSTRFLAGTYTAEAVSATVPAGFVWIVRDVDVFSFGDGDNLNIATGAGGYFASFLASATVSAWRGRQVLPEGELLTVEPNGGHWDFSVCGYALTM